MERGSGLNQLVLLTLIIIDIIDNMKKITLTIGLVAAMLSTKAQDTLCTYFTGKDVYHFDYQQDTILSFDEQTTRFYEVNIEYGDVLCLHFEDKKNKVRKVIITFWDGETISEVLDSKSNVYYSPMGMTKVLVSKPKLAIKL